MLNVLQICSGRRAALADNVVPELPPFIEAAHAGALDCRNMDEHVLPTVVRLNEAKPFCELKNFTVPVAISGPL